MTPVTSGVSCRSALMYLTMATLPRTNAFSGVASNKSADLAYAISASLNMPMLEKFSPRKYHAHG